MLLSTHCGCILLALAGCQSASPTSKLSPTIQPWSDGTITGRQITTEHFDLFSSLRDAELETALPEFLDSLYDLFDAYLPTSPQRPPVRLTTYVLADRTEWSRFTRSHYPQRYETYQRIHTGGFTDAHTSVVAHRQRSTTLASLAHEAWHQYVNTRLDPSMPTWLNEGLACHFETASATQPTLTRFVGGSRRPHPTIGRNAFRINDLRRALYADRLIPLPGLLMMDAGHAVRMENAQTYYAQVWALVSMLSDGGDPAFTKAFRAMMGDLATQRFGVRISAVRLGPSPNGTITKDEAPFTAYFDTSASQLSDRYHAYLMQLAGFARGPS